MKHAALLLFALSACSRGKISEREIRKQQALDQLTIKKQELSVVAGTYRGYLTGENGYRQYVILNLEIKDIPESQAQNVDPILVPKIMGNLRFQFGTEGSAEYIDAPILESEYLSTQHSLHVVVTHAQFDRMVLRFEETSSGDVLEGDWSADTAGAKGRVYLTRKP